MCRSATCQSCTANNQLHLTSARHDHDAPSPLSPSDKCAKLRQRKVEKHSIAAANSQKIRNMALLCAILVAAIHIDWIHDVPLSLGWFICNGVKDGYARIAVPFFFIVSGFFLAKHFEEDHWWGHEVNKRVHSLVIPFLLWSIISLIGALLLGIGADIAAHRPFGTGIYFIHGTNWLRIFGFDLTEWPLHVPLWYVRCLIFFVLTGHAFKYLVAKCRYAWIVMAFAFMLVQNHIPNENLRAFFDMAYSASGIFYFSVGIFMYMFNLTRTTKQKAISAGIMGFALLAAKLLFAYKGWRFEMMLGKLSIPFLIYFSWHFATPARLPNWLTACSFPIFLMHTILFGYCGVIIRRTAIGGLAQNFVVFFCGIAGAIAITVILRRFVPKVATMLFGGR